MIVNLGQDLFIIRCDNEHIGWNNLRSIKRYFLFQSKTVNSKMSSVDKMKKLLSPGTRKKGLGNRTFGVPLEELMSRAASGAIVPYVVSKICEHIRDKGKCWNTGKYVEDCYVIILVQIVLQSLKWLCESDGVARSTGVVVEQM